MRHPALTRFFAAFLAVVSVITLISGGICIKKAADDREKQNKSTLRLSDRTAEAKALLTELDAMPTSFAQKNAAYETAKERYDSEKLSYRKDLSIYTATEAALKQAQEKIDEGYASLRMGWIEHDNGEKALNDAEAQFRPGYEQYLDGKARLEEGRRQYEQAEALKESLPDLAILRTALNALKASKANIDASLDAIQNTLQNPPLDPETGEVDTEAQRAQLRRELLALSGQLAAVQTVLLEEYGPELLARGFPFFTFISEVHQFHCLGEGLVPARTAAEHEGVEQQPARRGRYAGFIHVRNGSLPVSGKIAAQFLFIEYVVHALRRQLVEAYPFEGGQSFFEAAALPVAISLLRECFCCLAGIFGIEGRAFKLDGLQSPIRPLLRLSGKRCGEGYGYDKG